MVPFFRSLQVFIFFPFSVWYVWQQALQSFWFSFRNSNWSYSTWLVEPHVHICVSVCHHWIHFPLASFLVFVITCRFFDIHDLGVSTRTSWTGFFETVLRQCVHFWQCLSAKPCWRQNLFLIEEVSSCYQICMEKQHSIFEIGSWMIYTFVGYAAASLLGITSSTL